MHMYWFSLKGQILRKISASYHGSKSVRKLTREAVVTEKDLEPPR
jgi:hypothetical protein